MCLDVVNCVLFCLLVNSSSRGEIVDRNFRQLERVVSWRDFTWNSYAESRRRGLVLGTLYRQQCTYRCDLPLQFRKTASARWRR